MAFTAEQRRAVINDYRLSETDTGSPEVQVALLTAQINHLTPHFAPWRILSGKNFNTAINSLLSKPVK
jgi:ribosomal protein S15P/S13E